MINKSQHIKRRDQSFRDFSYDEQFTPNVTDNGTVQRTPSQSLSDNELQSLQPFELSGKTDECPDIKRIDIPTQSDPMTKILEHGGDVGGFKVHRRHIVGIMPAGTKVILRVLKYNGNGWSPIGKSITHTLNEERHFEVIARLVPYKGHFPYEHDRFNWTASLMYPDEVIGQHRQIIYRLP